MSSIKETVQGYLQVEDKVKGVADELPFSDTPSSKDYSSSVLHAGAETLKLIDRLTRPEGLPTRALNTPDALKGYIQQLIRKEKGDQLAAGTYVLVEVGKEKFLGISRLAQRELSITELQEMYGNHSQEVLLAAKSAGRLQVTKDYGIQVSFSAMPLSAIAEVQQMGNPAAKVAASATATGILTSPESAKRVESGLEEHCHNEQPQLTLGESHIVTPLALAFASATDKNFAYMVNVTAGTTQFTHDTQNPTLGQTLHMHEVPTTVAQKQSEAVGQTGILGGMEMQSFTYWLQAWNKTVNGVHQPQLRQSFRIFEIQPEATLHIAKNLGDLSEETQLGITLTSGIALADSTPQELRKQFGKLVHPDSLSQPIRKVFTT